MNARLRLVSAACASALLAGWAIARFRSGPSPAEPGSHVAAAPSPRATNPRVTISTEGALSLTLLGAPDDRLGSLVRADAPHQRETLDRLQLRLERLAALEDLGDGPVLGALDVASAPSTPWIHVLWVLELATSPTVRTRTVRLMLPDVPESAVTPELSYGRGLSMILAGSDTISVVRVQLERLERTTPPATQVRMALSSVSTWDRDQFSEDGDPLAWMTSWTAYRESRALTARVCGTPPTCRAAILDIARPQRSQVTFGEVLDVLRALRDGGVAPVWILNRSTALPDAR